MVALFDNDASKIGQNYDGLTVEPIDSLRKVVAMRKIKPGDPVRSRRGRAACC